MRPDYEAPTLTVDETAPEQQPVEELPDAALASVSGGNDDRNQLKNKTHRIWTCQCCNGTITVYDATYPAKHMVTCSGNPFKSGPVDLGFSPKNGYPATNQNCWSDASAFLWSEDNVTVCYGGTFI